LDPGRQSPPAWRLDRLPATRAPALSVVAPCYNEAEGLAELYRRVRAAAQREVGDSFEIVLVNDGSSDPTWPAIAALAHDDAHVVGVNLARNYGHQLALTAGLTVARGDRVLIIDADLQDPPELLPEMMRLMDGGADVVYGQRSDRDGETWFKRTTATLFYRLLDRLTDVPIPVDTGDFRLMSRRALDILNAMPEQHRFIRGMVSWIGLRQIPVRYARQARFAGSTKYPLRRMLRFALDAITGFSVKPLRVTAWFGLGLAILALAAMGHVAWSFFAHRTVPGWTSLMATVLVIGSAQFLVLAVFGEYLGRLYMEAKRRPLFVIERVLRTESAEPSAAAASTTVTAAHETSLPGA
jgi:glycosyltransferase involved in cell wall biosynthesis